MVDYGNTNIIQQALKTNFNKNAMQSLLENTRRINSPINNQKDKVRCHASIGNKQSIRKESLTVLDAAVDSVLLILLLHFPRLAYSIHADLFQTHTAVL